MRSALAVVVVAASAALTAPVPKSLKTKVPLDAPRPLLVRTAVVEDGKLKLTGPNVWTRPEETDTRECPLDRVSVTDRSGDRLDDRALSARLKRPTPVVVVPGVGNGSHPIWPPAVVDAGDGWRCLLTPDAVVVSDLMGTLYGWDHGQFDVLIDPAKVDGRRVLAAPSERVVKRTALWWKTEWVLDADELDEVDAKRWEEWVRWVGSRGVAIHVRGATAPEGFEAVFREGMPPAFRTRPGTTGEASPPLRGVIR